MKREKRRTPFLYFLITGEVMAFFVAAVILIGATSALYYSFANRVKTYEISQMDAFAGNVHSEGENFEGCDENYLDCRLRFACCANVETAYADATVWIENSETGEELADSQRGLFWAMRSSTDEDLRIYYCPVDKTDNKWSQLENDIGKTTYILRDFDDMEYTVGNSAIDYFVPQKITYLDYEMHDAYVKDCEFIPGVVDMYKAELSESSIEESKELIATFDMSPANEDGYRHIDENEYAGLDMNTFFAVGGYSDVDKAKLKTYVSPISLGGVDYYFAQEEGPFPGLVSVLCKKDVTDILGRNVSVYRYTKRYFAKDCRGILQIMAGVFGIIAFIIGLFGARSKYLANKYFCDMNDYRKNLMDSMAHDLRSPLTIMGGYAQNLSEDVNSDKRQYYADSIIKNVEYMDKIIANNLLLSSLSVEEVTKDRQDVNLVAGLTDLLGLYQEVLAEKKAELVIEGEFVRKVNDISIKGALENVVSNAVKYVNPNGSIHVYTKGKSLIVANTTDEEILEKVDNLWKPFVKGDKSRGNEKGTGLGLAIAGRFFEINKLKARLNYDIETKTFMVIIE